MSVTTNPASAEPEQKPAPVLESPAPEQNATPASEPPVEEWDKERAAATIKAQRAEAKALKEQLKDYDRLKADEEKRKEAQMTELEKLQKQKDEAERKAVQLESDLLRRDVIAETGLSPIFAERLKGATKEEMLADAKVILEALPTARNPKQAPTNPGEATISETDAQKRERLFGKPANIFDFEEIKRQGGGVVIK